MSHRLPALAAAPSWTAAVALLAIAPGCGKSQAEKLAELEAKQHELRASYDQTAAQIADMRTQLEAMGVLNPAGAKPTKGKPGGANSAAKVKGNKVGHPFPSDNVTDKLGIAATRTGTPASLPALPEMVRAVDKPCGYTFQVKELQPISDFALNSIGLGRAGPLVLYQDGKALKPHAAPADYEGACNFAFRHAGYLILFSPEGKPENTKGTYTIGLDPAVPMIRGDDGRPVYWDYPGTTLQIATKNAWDPSWGPVDVDVVPRLIGAGAPPKVAIQGQTVDLPTDKESPHLHVTLDSAPSGPITVAVSSPPDGMYVILETLTIGNDDHAAVITSEAAFRSAQK